MDDPAAQPACTLDPLHGNETLIATLSKSPRHKAFIRNSQPVRTEPRFCITIDKARNLLLHQPKSSQGILSISIEFRHCGEGIILEKFQHFDHFIQIFWVSNQ
jgi:hypothetical protein